MTEFTPISALIGGALIGLAATLYLLFNAKIAGCSGILNQFFSVSLKQNAESVLFTLGLIIAPFIAALWGSELPSSIDSSWLIILVAGFLVGFGSNLGNGCTSGHGVCGIGRLSKRSIVATCTFMATAVLTVYLMKLI